MKSAWNYRIESRGRVQRRFCGFADDLQLGFDDAFRVLSTYRYSAAALLSLEVLPRHQAAEPGVFKSHKRRGNGTEEHGQVNASDLEMIRCYVHKSSAAKPDVSWTIFGEVVI